MFENKIRRPTFQGLDRHFLSEGTGDENKGNVRSVLLGKGQGCKAVKSRQAMVGKNNGRVEALDGVQEQLLGVDPLKGEIEATFLQSMLSEYGIVRLVLDH